jgi:hypothetical protein
MTRRRTVSAAPAATGYLTAWRGMDWSLDGTLVRNNSAQPLWFLRDGKTVRIESGQLMRLDIQ